MMSIRKERRQRQEKMAMAAQLLRSTERLNQQLKRGKRQKHQVDPNAIAAVLGPTPSYRRFARLNRAHRYFQSFVRSHTWGGDGIASRVPTKAIRNARREQRRINASRTTAAAA